MDVREPCPLSIPMHIWCKNLTGEGMVSPERGADECERNCCDVRSATRSCRFVMTCARNAGSCWMPRLRNGTLQHLLGVRVSGFLILILPGDGDDGVILLQQRQYVVFDRPFSSCFKRHAWLYGLRWLLYHRCCIFVFLDCVFFTHG